MNTSRDLQEILRRIDRRGYPAYKDTRGSYQFHTPGGEAYILRIEHVQGDPFAAPSSLSVTVSGSVAGFPPEYYDARHKANALCDFLLRAFSREISAASKRLGSGKSGTFGATRPGQEILPRTGCCIDWRGTGDLIVRFDAGFPAHGRTIDARQLERMLFADLPEVIERTLLYRTCRKQALERQIQLIEDRQYIEQQLAEQGLIGFVADGAVLPRESGVSQRPMQGAVPFRAPKSMSVTMDLPHFGPLRGMGIRRGITLIVGGGYHGKSTLLKALETGIYPHIPGDGREYIVTDPAAVKIRAEDGRRIDGTDISLFISDLPNGKDTHSFRTDDASGSTSQAANTVEAMEAGCSALLIDEDTSATNFMVRDDLMQEVIHPEHEPITPFLERIRDLYEQCGISTIIVAGSSGAFFRDADRIIQMDHYRPIDITERAKAAAAAHPVGDAGDPPPFQEPSYDRIPQHGGDLRYKGRIKIRTNGTDGVEISKELIDLRYLEQLVTSQQLTCLGKMTAQLLESRFDGHRTLQDIVEEYWSQIEADGFAALRESGSGGSTGTGGQNRRRLLSDAQPGLPGNLTMPRKQELYACINRYRKLKIR